MNTNEKPQGSARDSLIICIGELSVMETTLRATLVEMASVRDAYTKALDQPMIVATDTVAALPDRIVELRRKLLEALG